MNKTEGKGLVVRHASRWGDSIKIYLKETEWKDVDMINRTSGGLL